jgi:transposase
MLLGPPQNRSAREVAEILGVNVATIYRAKARW